MSTQSIIAESTAHLKALVKEAIDSLGPNADLNHIDVSSITDMARLFEDSPFNGNVSAWDVSSVENFDSMFRQSSFTGDVANWDTRSAQSMRRMFHETDFGGDVSRWNVGELTHAEFMFDHSRFACDVSAWRPAKLINAENMFCCSRFNADVSGWRLPQLRNATAMFDKTPFAHDLSSWHLPKVQADYAARLVPGTYTGVLPHLGGDFKDRRDFYRGIFKIRRGSTGLTAYLEDHPFNAMHLDFALHSAARIPGVSDQDLAWVKNVKAAGLALGLDADALWAYAFASLKERGQEMVVEGVDFCMSGD